jgi:hypothetical protein
MTDRFSGVVAVNNPTADASGVGIRSATIEALGGEDAIEGIATITSSSGSAEAYGILSSRLEADRNNDTIRAIGTASGAISSGYGISQTSVCLRRV